MKCYTVALFLAIAATSSLVSVQARGLSQAKSSPVPSPMPSPMINGTNSTNGTNIHSNHTVANTTYGEILSNPKLSTTAMLINATGLVPAINNLTGALLILPTDIAWFLYLDAVNTTMPALLKREKGEYAKKLLLNHVVLDEGDNMEIVWSLFNTTESDFLTTAAGQTIFVTKNLEDEPMIVDMLGRSGLLIDQDEEYEKNMIIVLDSVLMVEMADSLEELYSLLPGHFSFFHTAIKMTEYKSILKETKSNYTVLSPFNQAWMAYASRVGATIDELLANEDLLSSMVGSSIYKGGAKSVMDFYKAGSNVSYTMAYEESSFTAEYNKAAKLLMLTGAGAEVGHNTFVIEADLVAGGSFVQGIDQLLVTDDAGYGPYAGNSNDYTKEA